jgi:sterol desaturase/sphingolipid hydroxylase (fatty acid hydroxylase superfamily)
VKPFEAFYVRHVPVHHALFVPGEMALRGLREVRLVLLPGVALPVLLAVSAPIAAGLVLAGQRNLGLLWLATAALHYLVFEGLHLAYHLPEESWLGRTRMLALLRHHHERHHSPRLKSRWNFNVTLPLWDLVRGTLRRPHAVPRAAPVRRSH